jgi:PHS family inorganic phosphate transporter-like MFS transporter
MNSDLSVQLEDQPATKNKSNFIPMLGNFNIQYNFTAASIAVKILSSSAYLGHALRDEPSWADTITLPIVFVGAMTGMLVMGRLGDVLGRNRAMQVTLSLSVAGCIIPALSAGNADATFGILNAGRLILGVGVGGIYPLSAVSSAEGTDKAEDRGRRVGMAFFFQSIGCLVPYIVAMILLASLQPSTPESWVPQFQFRFLFALGAVPGLIVIAATFREKSSTPEVPVSVEQPGLRDAFRHQPAELKMTLFGTSGSWFLYDVAYYGTNIFTPTLLGKICLTGSKVDGVCTQSLFETAWQSVIVQAMGIPACFIAIHLIGKYGSRFLNIMGFTLLALLFLLMAIVWTANEDLHMLLFVIFCAITFCLNFGPNLGTYVLPAICFPYEVRSTCHGISAFGGKLGAVVGTLIFKPVSHMGGGISALLFMQAAVCLAGAIVGHFFLKSDFEYLRPEDKEATETFLSGIENARNVRLSGARLSGVGRSDSA